MRVIVFVVITIAARSTMSIEIVTFAATPARSLPLRQIIRLPCTTNHLITFRCARRH